MSLTLTRRVGEGVTLTVPPSETETRINVKSVGVRGQQTQLSFVASRGVKIMRDELIERDLKAAQEQGAA
jgi:sRNA-binding carbon storage regulator CsrA